MLGNQRFGYEEISGDVTYGGTNSEEMSKKYRSEVLYNPEDDLHYATLKVKDTLRFALKTKTPGKNSRNEGESRKEYVKEFLRVVSKLFWIEHTMDTKVGNEFVRGVSGGEKKRVSIAEAMVTKVGRHYMPSPWSKNLLTQDPGVRPELGQLDAWPGCQHSAGICPEPALAHQHG